MRWTEAGEIRDGRVIWSGDTKNLEGGVGVLSVSRLYCQEGIRHVRTLSPWLLTG